MLKPKQLRAKDIKPLRDTLLEQQNFKCPLCCLRVDSPALDHSHQNEKNPQHIRAVLCRTCNTTLGAVYNKLQRSGLINKLQVDGAISWLYNAAIYYQQDYSKNPYHPNRLLDLLKEFKNANKPIQVEMLLDLNIKIPEKATKEDLVKLYKSYLKTL
jgi:hypothetical protein